MLEFIQEFNTLMIAVLVGLFIAIIAVANAATSKLKAERDEARSTCEELRRELNQARSSGADLAQRIGWRKRRLMNKPEFSLYCELQQLLARSRDGQRLFAQVSFGAFLEATARADLEDIKKAAYFSVQRKVADFVIIDRVGLPVIVIEYQGDGHYQGRAHDRDHAKRIACQMAGVPLMEVPAVGLSEGQRIDLSRILGAAPAVAAE